MATEQLILDFEEWRQIEDFPDYAVSSRGQVKRIRDTFIDNVLTGGLSIRGKAGKIMGQTFDTDGYLTVGLAKKGSKSRTKRIHALVCAAFHGPKPSNKHHAAHWNGVKTDNTPNNLRWVVPKQNKEDSIRLGETARGTRNGGGGKLVEENVLEIKRRLALGKETLTKIASDYGVTRVTIARIRNGRLWTWLS